MAAKISKEYQEKAIELMSLNITEKEMYVLLPSENDDQIYYRVDLVEETMTPTRCSCRGFCRWKRCKHVTLTSEAFAGYAASAPEPTPVDVVEVVESEPVEPKITEVEAGNWYIINSNTGIWRREDDGEWMTVGEMPLSDAIELVEAYIEKQQAVKEAEQIVASPVAQPEPAQEVVSPVEQRRDYELDMLRSALTSNSGFQVLRLVS